MRTIKNVIKKIPFITNLYKNLRNKYIYRKLLTKGTEEVFSEIFHNRAWIDSNSISGRGSDIPQTRKIVQELPDLFKKFEISSILDIPCGDFYWFKDLDLNGINYTGADIVEEIVENNSKMYLGNSRNFVKLDLIRDVLPEVDLIFCRDCMVHFSFNDIRDAFANICKSGSTYLMTTTFREKPRNDDIATGQWRALNLEVSPFQLPKPIAVINENFMEADGVYADKSLALWRISDIQECLIHHN